jgi:hypothetical protein
MDAEIVFVDVHDMRPSWQHEAARRPGRERDDEHDGANEEYAQHGSQRRRERSERVCGGLSGGWMIGNLGLGHWRRRNQTSALHRGKRTIRGGHTRLASCVRVAGYLLEYEPRPTAVHRDP